MDSDMFAIVSHRCCLKGTNALMTIAAKDVNNIQRLSIYVPIIFESVDENAGP